MPGLVLTVLGDDAGGCTDTSVGSTLPGICHVCIPGVDSESLLFLAETDGVYAAAASSCASGAQQSSHVLTALGVEPLLADGALRLSLGWDSCDADVDLALEVLPAAIERVRSFG